MAALACCIAGVLLSRVVDPRVRVEAGPLAPDVPALRFVPVAPGPHPRALLAHGVTASKETMFRLGEALAACGFSCAALDLPGHGESPLPFAPADNPRVIDDAVEALGGVDVFVGHSMGAYAGARAASLERARCRVALGALPAGGPTQVLLLGRLEEAVSVEEAARRPHTVVSPWSDHALEPYDPVLVQGAVEAACASAGLSPVAPSGAWVWRLLGLVLAVAGAVVLADRVLPPRLRGVGVAVLALAAVALSGGAWLSVAPMARRLPAQAAAAGLAALVAVGAARCGVPRRALAALPLLAAAALAVAGAPFKGLFAALFGLVCLGGVLVGAVAQRGADRLQGDIAFALLVGYALGQWRPL